MTQPNNYNYSKTNSQYINYQSMQLIIIFPKYKPNCLSFLCKAEAIIEKDSILKIKGTYFQMTVFKRIFPFLECPYFFSSVKE